MSVTTEPENKRIRAYDLSYLKILPRVRQFFEQERKEHNRIYLNGELERIAAATGVGRHIVAKVQTLENDLNWKKEPGVPVPTPNEPVIPTNFSSIIRQVIRENISSASKFSP